MLRILNSCFLTQHVVILKNCNFIINKHIASQRIDILFEISYIPVLLMRFLKFALSGKIFFKVSLTYKEHLQINEKNTGTSTEKLDKKNSKKTKIVINL